MSSSPAAQAMRRSTVARLDDATTEAVLEYGKALREVRRLDRATSLLMSPEKKRGHTQALEFARRRMREARLGLDVLLVEEDA